MIDFGNPGTWVTVFLCIFLGILFWKKVPGMIADALDKRSADIQSELDEARKLREEAQHILADYQRKAREAEQEADTIIAQAKKEAENFAKETRAKLEETLERRSKAADLKIAQAEAKAVDEVRTAAIEAAIKASEKLLTGQTAGSKGDELINKSIAELKQRMN